MPPIDRNGSVRCRPKRRGPRGRALGAGWLAWLLLPLLGVAVSVSMAGARPVAEEPELDDPPPERSEPRPSSIEEHVEVTANRLPGASQERWEVPAHTTVIDRRRLEESKAETLQQLLEHEAAVVHYDQTGNGIETIFDFRGFSDGRSVKVFLDGAPLNDPDNHAVPLQLVPLDALGRVEIVRGSVAAFAGAGAQSGVLQLQTADDVPETLRVDLRMASHDEARFAGRVSGRRGPLRFSISAAGQESDGFRENGGGSLRQFVGTMGFDLGSTSDLRLSLVDSSSELGVPGALTLEEFERQPWAAPYNGDDFSEQRLRQLALNLRTSLGASQALTLNLFQRRRSSESLSTGRAASRFGGFLFDSHSGVHGAALQWTRTTREDRALTAGGEFLVGKTQAAGFTTAAEDPGNVDLARPSAASDARRGTFALFLENSWRPAPDWSVLVGARLDHDRVRFSSATAAPRAELVERFSELSLRAGITWTATARDAWYAAYGESFLPPTAEQLFAFPGFGSNPDLKPEDSHSIELGYRRRLRDKISLEAVTFLVDTRDEIVFDPDAEAGLFGANVNGGRARRRGLELELHGWLTPRVELRSSATLVDAEIRSGPHTGQRVPLVPDWRLGISLRKKLPFGLELRLGWLHSGEQVLANDEANRQPRIEAFTVTDCRLSWQPLARDGEGPRWFLEATNLFDRRYATRGIYAFDFAANVEAVFLTPAPGRRWRAGLDWDF